MFLWSVSYVMVIIILLILPFTECLEKYGKQIRLSTSTYDYKRWYDENRRHSSELKARPDDRYNVQLRRSLGRCSGFPIP
ncbi:hypothetical protein COOONC_20371 [Cooperia oncophora]